MQDERLVLTVSEAAKALGLSRGFAYQMAREGKLPTVRFGHRLVVSRKGLDELLAGSKESPKGSK
jgi:excisionase family DNA binding protein